MAKKASDSFEDYMAKLDKIKLTSSRHNLGMWTDEEAAITPENINKWCREGEALLAAEKREFIKDETKKLEKKLGSTSTNPYVRARIEILNKMPKDKLKLIEEMENGTRPKDHRYDTFVKEVTALGDKMSS